MQNSSAASSSLQLKNTAALTSPKLGLLVACINNCSHVHSTILHGDIALTGTVFLACGLLGYIIYKSGRKDKMITVPMATFDVFSVIK
eukprot:scaffold22142_cov91-Skeletonema_marinoi.AAC.1